VETSADQGATWQASPPVTFQALAKSVTCDFAGTAADGTGLLARAWVEAPTVPATPYCTWAWQHRKPPRHIAGLAVTIRRDRTAGTVTLTRWI